MKTIQLMLRRLEVKICKRKNVYVENIEIQNKKVYQKWKLVRVPKRIYCS